MAIPGIKHNRFYHKRWFAELVGSVPPIAVLIIAALINAKDSDATRQSLSYWGYGAAAWLAIASLIKIGQASKQDKEEKQKYDYDGLTAALNVLFASISRKVGFSVAELDSGRLRITIHRVDGEDLEQLIPYIGGKGGEPGRRFSIRSGIIGKAVLQSQSIAASRQNNNYEDYLTELAAKWSYTAKDARALSPDRMSWMAVPIFYRNKEVEAVVYLDSIEQGFFDAEVKTLAINSCAGIASYIKERYQ